MRKIINSGTQFDKLTVICDAGTIKGDSYSWVVCECGSKIKKVRNANLTSNKTKSCGCQRQQGIANKIYDKDRLYLHLTPRDYRDEQWKTYDSIYEVSTLGRIRNKLTNHILNPQITSNNKYKGYLQVNLNGKTQYIHRLVAEVWFNDFDGSLPCHHVNENTFDNRISNIEQISHKNNVRIARARKVKGFTPNGELKYEFDCMSDGEDFGFSKYGICSCCTGHRKTHKGIRWEYA